MMNGQDLGFKSHLKDAPPEMVTLHYMWALGQYLLRGRMPPTESMTLFSAVALIYLGGISRSP